MAQRVTVSTELAERLAPWYGSALPSEVPVLCGSLAGWLFGLSGQHAVTINGAVHLTGHAPELSTVDGTVLLGHELYHVEQQRQLGWWRFLAGYLWRWRPAHIRRGWEHPYEVPAYARGREIREALGG